MTTKPIQVTGSMGEGTIGAPGTKIKDLRTPALLMDLDGMERNLARMADFFRDKPAKLRPHFKAHQVLALARRQIQMGAVGITCARLEQAEALVDEGIKNVLIANEIAGASMIQRFIDLSQRAPVIVAVDNPRVVCDMAFLAGKWAQDLNVVVDLDVRLGRCGVRTSEEALALARLVIEKGLTFRGLMGYEGHISLPDGPEKQKVAHTALQRLIDVKTALERADIPVEVVTCGGSSDFSISASYPGVTEIQAGSYLLMDTWYVPFAPQFEPTLTVLATVISKSPDKIVTDAGIRATSGENGLPTVKNSPGLRMKVMHVEHTIIEVTNGAPAIDIGDKIEIWVRFLDPTLCLHPCFYGVRGDEVKEILKIEKT